MSVGPRLQGLQRLAQVKRSNSSSLLPQVLSTEVQKYSVTFFAGKRRKVVKYYYAYFVYKGS